MKTLLLILALALSANADTVPIQDVLPGWSQDYRQPVSEMIALRRESGETSGYVCVGLCFKVPGLDLNLDYLIPAALIVTAPPILSFLTDDRGPAPVPVIPPVISPDNPQPVPEANPLAMALLAALIFFAHLAQRAWRDGCALRRRR